jgi:putative oxidoreductase
MRRLFSNFAHGAPGMGLLLMRVVSGTTLLVEGYLALRGRPPLGPALLEASSIGLGILLIAGLWTPVTGSLIALEALWNVFSDGYPWLWLMLATLGAALALIGPGGWSLDARLFGWKRLDIRTRTRKSGSTPP